MVNLMSIHLEAEMRWSVWRPLSIYFLPELLRLRRSKGKEQRWVRGQRSGHSSYSDRCLWSFDGFILLNLLFFLQGMLSARICKSLNGIPVMKTNGVCFCVWAVWMFVVTVHVSDRTDCVFPLWCVCALIRTSAGPAALSASAPETAPVRCSLERCKQPPHLTTPHSLASLMLWTFGSHVLFSLCLCSVCSLRRLKEVKLTHWKK